PTAKMKANAGASSMTKDERQSTVSAYFQDLQERICAALTQADGKGAFREDNWKREAGGGGRTRIISEGAVFEKGGVNFSEVAGEMSPEFAAQIPGEGRAFTATGISLVLHPGNPFVPTVHANFRYLTKGAKEWFGGGADLTPYYPYREDVIHFHRVWKQICDRHRSIVEYQRLKKWCDEYFFLSHRGEPRGVGGVFFDYLEGDWEAHFAFVRDCGDAFLYVCRPIVARRKDLLYTVPQRRY